MRGIYQRGLVTSIGKRESAQTAPHRKGLYNRTVDTYADADGKETTSAAEIAAGRTDPAADTIDAIRIAAAGKDRGNDIGGGVVKETSAVADTVDTDAIDRHVMATNQLRYRNQGAVTRHEIGTAAVAPGSIIVSSSRTIGTKKRHRPSKEYAANSIRDL